MKEILDYLWRMVPAACLGLLCCALAYVPRQKRMCSKGYATTASHEAGLTAFIVLLAGLLWLTVLPRILWQDGGLIFREEGLGEVNLRLFLIFKQSRILHEQGHKNYFLINFWGNIAMFLPVGFFPAVLWRGGKWWKAALIGLTLSLAIELCQIPINRGTDVDDLWLNTLGALAGYWLSWGFSLLFPGTYQRFRVKELDIWTGNRRSNLSGKS